MHSLMKIQALVFGLLLIAGIRTTSAQAVSFGVTGGIRLTEGTQQHDESRPYVIGPSVEIRLPAGFAVEVDALYQRIGSTSTFVFLNGTAVSSFINRQRGNYWQFPLLGKYYFRPRSEGWQPFVETGYAFRVTGFHSAGSIATTDSSGNTVVSAFRNDYRSALEIGAVVGAGARFRAGRFALLPEIRYTRWGDNNNGITPRNEAGLLLGIAF
jgi:hypothetical protein